MAPVGGSEFAPLFILVDYPDDLARVFFVHPSFLSPPLRSPLHYQTANVRTNKTEMAPGVKLKRASHTQREIKRNSISIIITLDALGRIIFLSPGRVWQIFFYFCWSMYFSHGLTANNSRRTCVRFTLTFKQIFLRSSLAKSGPTGAFCL